MTARLLCVLVASGAALLAAAAVRTVWAETAYERGLSLSQDPKDSPAVDVPGRLEEYLEAFRRDPDEARYALRAGQVRLSRARRTGGATDPAELDAAVALLSAASELRPLDWRARAELARAARLGGDAGGAAWHAAAAVRLGPRAGSSLAAAADAAAWAWRASGDTSALRTALVAASNLARIGETRSSRAVAPRLADAGATLAGDVVQATAGDPALRDFAASLLADSRPDLARTLVDGRSTGQ